MEKISKKFFLCLQTPSLKPVFPKKSREIRLFSVAPRFPNGSASETGCFEQNKDIQKKKFNDTGRAC
jgi:hypothetical protein